MDCMFVYGYHASSRTPDQSDVCRFLDGYATAAWCICYTLLNKGLGLEPVSTAPRDLPERPSHLNTFAQCTKDGAPLKV